jgi:conjugative transposon TraJ protein
MFISLAINWDNLHGLLRGVYDEMMPLCGNMMGLAKGIAGLGALFYIAYRVWKSLANAEPIDVYPLLRPFVIGIAIMFFPTLVVGTINGVLSPVTRSCAHLVDRQIAEAQSLQTQKDKLERESMMRDPTQAYLVDDEEYEQQLSELGILDAPQVLWMMTKRLGYKMKTMIIDAFR